MKELRDLKDLTIHDVREVVASSGYEPFGNDRDPRLGHERRERFEL